MIILFAGIASAFVVYIGIRLIALRRMRKYQRRIVIDTTPQHIQEPWQPLN
jgi:hypothetical protein